MNLIIGNDILNSHSAKVNKLLNKINRISEFYSNMNMGNVSEKLKIKYVKTINLYKETLDGGHALSKDNMNTLNIIWAEIREDYKNIK